MKNITIVIDGKEYPARETMGALKRFRDETGREATQIKPDSISDLATYLYCCVASACHHDKVDFNMSLMDFLDSATQEVVTAWVEALNATRPNDGGADEKKS